MVIQGSRNESQKEDMFAFNEESKEVINEISKLREQVKHQNLFSP